MPVDVPLHSAFETVAIIGIGGGAVKVTFVLPPQNVPLILVRTV